MYSLGKLSCFDFLNGEASIVNWILIFLRKLFLRDTSEPGYE